MPASTRIIKRRIKSVGNTKKITKAMELVSASKMRRAVNSVLASRSYADLAWETLTEVSKLSDPSLHYLLAERSSSKKILIVLITSDRGLCAGFNAQMIKKVLQFEKQTNNIDFAVIGKKGQHTARRLKWNIVASFNNLSVVPSIKDIRPIASLAINDFKKGIYDQVILAFTDFVSSLKQIPRLKQLLPLTKVEGLGEIESQDKKDEVSNPIKKQNKYNYQYIFEPSPSEVLEQMLPRLIEIQIYQAILESSASEHSARMMAMRNATEAAGDMINDLTFTFNQARQATITREIAEISAGKIVLE